MSTTDGQPTRDNPLSLPEQVTFLTSVTVKQLRVLLHQGNWECGDGQHIECEVLTDSGQTVQCEVLTDSGQTVQVIRTTNVMQHVAFVFITLFGSTLHVSGALCTHHQECI